MTPIPEKVICDLQTERTYQLTKGAAGKVPNMEGWSYDFGDLPQGKPCGFQHSTTSSCLLQLHRC
jgi:hypothetical protein